ncbi:zinc finger domain containing protein [Acanthamoeba castellanii str. Neff]|uniref:Zinc finger domain containing protein n=1 Tax=Acanthamoeba castellanii (strain ATCC 30010 / Neff) TaxID=1257118 RepID=L8GIB2_ACACF|nr:zinc finger domain containing protein [Acanthamoeba castellanii str. Neff]ELR11921.1 zinc finger domain containing protein [Acanthamoeba castellanii str. Neff]
MEMDISEEVSGAEEGEASSSRNSDDKEETEAKGAEEKQPQQSAVPDAAPPDGVDAPRKKPNTKKTKHKKTLNDVCMPMRQQAERESGQREHGDQTGEAATAPPGNDTKLKGSRKKAKKLHKAMEAGKAKEAVRDSSSISAETVATVTMGGREEEEEESATIGLLDLPEEVLLGVLSFLAPLDLVLVSQACRLLQLLSREPTILRALREHHRIHKGKKRARLQPLFVHPAYYALEQPRYTLKQLESLETPSVVLDRLVEDGFFFLSLDEADLQIVRDMKAAASRFLASSEGLDAMSRRSMLYLKTSAAGYAEAPEINSFQTTVTHHRWFPWPDATDEDKAVATRYWRLMGRITVVLLTNLAKHLGIPMSVMELLLFSRKKVMHRYGDDSFLASDSVHVQWSCELCTLLNPGTRRTCAACQGPRPLARPEAVSADQVESEQTHGDGQQPRPLNEAATKETAETTAETIGSPFTREKVVAVTDEELDRLLAPTLKFYRFREIEKRRKDGWRGRDGSLRVFSAMTPRGANPAAAAAAADVVDVDHGLGAGDGMIHLLEEPTPLPLPPPLPQPTREDAQHQQHQQQSTGEQQRRKRKADFSTQLNMMPCNAMYSDSDMSSRSDDLARMRHRFEGSEDEAILADVSYWNGPMPLTKHERRERDRRDKRKRRIKKAKKVALTTAFVAAVPVTIVTAPIWLPIGKDCPPVLASHTQLYLAPWMDPALKVEMVGETGAVVSTLMLLDGGFEPDLLVSAGTVGGWSDRFNVGDVGLCAGGQSIPYSDRNISANAGYQAYGWGHFPCTAVVPDEVLAAAGVRPALIATHHSFVAPPDEAARLTAWGVDMVEQEGAAVAQQALFYGVPFMKVGGVVNSYALPHQNCAADLFFSCWKNTASKVANTTISIIKQVVHHNI